MTMWPVTCVTKNKETSVARKTKPVPVPVPRPEPSAREQVAIAEAAKRIAARPKPPEINLKAEQTNGRVLVEFGPSHSDHQGWSARILDAMGTRSSEFANAELERMLAAMQPQEGLPKVMHLNAALAVVSGVSPRNELEAMLASQMAVTHALAMDMLGRTKQSPTVPYMQICAGIATKLQRTFVAQAEALAKLRRGGEQKVTVEHVHVHAGGQAIVGAVTNTPSAGGGGEATKGGSQAHAQSISHASEPSVWSENAEREAVPLAGRDGEGPL
jgi:hypothetical protein